VGNWDTSCDVMGIPYKDEITILSGVKMRNTAKKSALDSWTRLAALYAAITLTTLISTSTAEPYL